MPYRDPERERINARERKARFGTMTDAERGELVVQFSYRGHDVTAQGELQAGAAFGAVLRDYLY